MMGTFKPRIAAFAAAAVVCAGAGVALAQFDSLRALDGQLGVPPDGNAEMFTVRAEFTAPADQQPALLRITAEIADGWHTYSITQPDGGPIRTTSAIDEGEGYRIKGAFRATTPPEAHVEPAFDGLVVEEHRGIVTWEAPLEFDEGVELAKLEIRGHVRAQLCSTTCLPARRFTFVARLAEGDSGEQARGQDPPAGRPEPASADQSALYRPEGLHAGLGIRFRPPVAVPGETVELVVRIEPDPGYHVYGLPEQMGSQVGMPTIVVIESGGPLRPGEVRANRPIEQYARPNEAGKMSRYYTRPVEFTLPLAVSEGLAGSEISITGLVGLQTCTDQN